MRGLLGMLYWNDTFWKKQTVWVNICLMIINRGAYFYGICFRKTSWKWYFSPWRWRIFFYPFLLLFANPIKSHPLLKWIEQVAFMLLIQQTPPQKQSYSKMDEVAKNILTNQSDFHIFQFHHCKCIFQAQKIVFDTLQQQ